MRGMKGWDFARVEKLHEREMLSMRAQYEEAANRLLKEKVEQAVANAQLLFQATMMALVHCAGGEMRITADIVTKRPDIEDLAGLSFTRDAETGDMIYRVTAIPKAWGGPGFTPPEPAIPVPGDLPPEKTPEEIAAEKAADDDYAMAICDGCYDEGSGLKAKRKHGPRCTKKATS